MSGSIYSFYQILLQISAGICPAPGTSANKDTVSTETQLSSPDLNSEKETAQLASRMPVYPSLTLGSCAELTPTQQISAEPHRITSVSYTSIQNLKGFLKSLELPESFSTFLVHPNE